MRSLSVCTITLLLAIIAADQHVPFVCVNPIGSQLLGRGKSARMADNDATFGNKWAHIARTIANGRTGQQCLIRWKNQLTPGINWNSWGEDEDRTLQVLKKNGGSWAKIAAGLSSGRTAKQCQERRTNVLDEARMTADWSKDEDQLLLEKYDEMNGKFAKVLLWLPGWSYNDCQKRFWVLHPEKAPKKVPICKHNFRSEGANTTSVRIAFHVDGAAYVREHCGAVHSLPNV